MIRKIDGFDLCDGQSVALKYNGFGSSFYQANMVLGKDGLGRALQISNTAFGEVHFFDILTPQAVWGFSADVKFDRIGTTRPFNAVAFYYWGTSGGALLSLWTRADGKIDIRAGDAGGVLATSTQTLALDTWYTIEAQAQFGTGGSALLRINQVAAATTSVVNFGVTLPDRMGFRWSQFGTPGLDIDNYAVFDGQVVAGDAHSTFLGPVRVTSFEPLSDASTVWTPRSGATCTPMVNDNLGRAGGSPDGDATYIDSAGAPQLFHAGTSPCFGQNFCLALNICARPLIGDQVLQSVVQLSSSPVILGSRIIRSVGQVNPFAPAATRDYLTYQTIAAINPETLGLWRDSEITAALFGVQTNTGSLRATALYPEKLTSLLPLPYDCGGADYSF